MVLAAVVVALLGFILKLMAVEPAGWFLVPLAAAMCIYHIRVHVQAAGSANPPRRLAALSDILLLGALLLQIDFGFSYNCGHSTIDSVAWKFGWSSELGCTLTRGLPAILLDLTYYIPVVVIWSRLRTYSAPDGIDLPSKPTVSDRKKHRLV
jgi:hypothetical protein